MTDLSSLNDEDLLKLKISDLGLKIDEGSDLSKWIARLHTELETKGLKFKPGVYLGDEWFSPEGVATIAIPFVLAHTRLKSLERKLMLEVEGETEEWFMRLIRHEAGHCFDHIYGFSKTKRWHDLFGSPEKEYDPDHYRPRPYSKSFVRNIENWYAQAHPDEDFAETFAVWLTPDLDWRKIYAKWPVALKKLEYIESLAHEAKATEKRVEKLTSLTRANTPYAAARIGKNLESYYAKRRKEKAQDYPDFYDVDLVRIFSGEMTLSKKDFAADKLLAKNRREIVDSVSRWTGERKFRVNALLKKLIERTKTLELRRPDKSELKPVVEFSAYLTSLISNYLFTGRFKRRH